MKNLKVSCDLETVTLVRQLHDCAIRDHGVQALAEIADSRTLELLVEVVGVEVANHCQGNVRRVAARGLGKIGSTANNSQVTRQAVDKLTWTLLNAEDWALRYASVVSLQEIATTQGQTALQQALSQERDKVSPDSNEYGPKAPASFITNLD